MKDIFNDFVQVVLKCITIFVIVFFGTLMAIQVIGLEKRCDNNQFIIDVIRATKENPTASIVIIPAKNYDCKGDK